MNFEKQKNNIKTKIIKFDLECIIIMLIFKRFLSIN